MMGINVKENYYVASMSTQNAHFIFAMFVRYLIIMKRVPLSHLEGMYELRMC
jgi:hypothetical protein